MVLALAGARVLSAVLYGVEAWDPPALIGAGILLVVVSLLATLVPTLLALRIHPLEALQSEP